MKSIDCFFKLFICIPILHFISIVSLHSQDTIYLKNPSFEDMPRKGGMYSTFIMGWKDCGLQSFPGESPPDIHPVPEKSAWGVTMEPFDGHTYLGLVIRYNDTYESVSQELSRPLEEGKCYLFSALLAKSKIYKSGTRRSRGELENFAHPAILKIWGGDDFSSRGELLAETVPVDNNQWMIFDFNLSPDKNWTAITIEAFYDKATLQPYNGNIMVDNLSPIVEVECNN